MAIQGSKSSLAVCSMDGTNGECLSGGSRAREDVSSEAASEQRVVSATWSFYPSFLRIA